MRVFEGGHSGPVYCVSWSADSAMIASGSEDKKVIIIPLYKYNVCSKFISLFCTTRSAYGSLAQVHSSTLSNRTQILLKAYASTHRQ